MINLDAKWDRNKQWNEAELVGSLLKSSALSAATRIQITDHASDLVEKIRKASNPGLMDVFLAEYGLSTDEGVALMCLAEALLRVPDATTIDALIEDKIAPSDWSSHIGRSSSPMVNASTWGLLLTGKVLDDSEPGIAGRLRNMVRRLGEPVIRTAVGAAMREMGKQFVLGQDIRAAMKRAAKKEATGYTYSYDMLGEAAMTDADAKRYEASYAKAIDAISGGCIHDEIAANPGISVKLSALHPRYEVAKTERVMDELVPVLTKLALQASKAGMGLNIDAEEMDRLNLSMKVIETVLANSALAGWDGFGVVVQAYGRRAGDIISGLYDMAERYDRKIMVRLVKGAYWDTEIKLAQVEGLDDFPVFTRKIATDVSYIAMARKLLSMTDRIYPQFATHNAHTVSAILEMAKDHELSDFEFQRLHGMGEALHSIVKDQSHTRCRIYAPVGAHRDLLAYLVRRLLENGANSSFVNQIVDETVPAIEVAACPLTELEGEIDLDSTVISTGPNLFMPERANSVGYDLSDITVLEAINAVRTKPHSLSVGPMIEGRARGGSVEEIVNPANGEVLGEATFASLDDVETAMTAAMVWDAPAEERARVLSKAADLYEENYGRFFALLACEAGKTLADAVAELREAVDFLRYYAANAEGLANGPRGIFTCISPWNFPLAIFSGQISAALAAGNAVLAKPAETTSAIGAFGVELMQQAGVPKNVLQLLPGLGATVGAALVSDARVGGVVFTGSTATARRIQGMMADHCLPGTPLIAETGGLNAMIVDSTALPEQAIRDIVASAFQSAGQRCSALRCLYVQEDIAPAFKEMLTGAMNELDMGDPWCLSSDLGPVITPNAQADISAYVNEAKAQGRLLHRLQPVDGGNFVAPALIAVNGIGDLTHEVFGPILHLATFPANGLDQVVEAVNATGYGLTFGLHTRIDDRVQSISQAVHAGNVYANRNQIGAIVGSQPFGGEGLSGTGPKAGGPHYLGRFTATAEPRFESNSAGHADINDVAERIFASGKNNSEIGSTILPGPTGELNRLTIVPRMPILCVGPGEKAVNEQVTIVKGLGGNAVGIPDNLSPDALGQLVGFAGVLWWGDADKAKEYAKTLAELDGPIIPLITSIPDQAHVVLERHLCVDTTAAGGNTSLLSGNDG